MDSGPDGEERGTDDPVAAVEVGRKADPHREGASSMAGADNHLASAARRVAEAVRPYPGFNILGLETMVLTVDLLMLLPILDDVAKGRGVDERAGRWHDETFDCSTCRPGPTGHIAVMENARAAITLADAERTAALDPVINSP